MIRSLPLVAASALLGAAALAEPLNIELPFGEIPTELRDPASQMVVAQCSGCHSLDYITTQPRGKGEQFWRDLVTKMVGVYKAPITPEDAETVTQVLAEKFG